MHSKFTAFVDRKRRIVKFATDATDNARHWRDLLTLEHVALQTLRNSGIDAATTEIVDVNGLRSLVVDRFDRVGETGRRAVVTLIATSERVQGTWAGWRTRADRLNATHRQFTFKTVEPPKNNYKNTRPHHSMVTSAKSLMPLCVCSVNGYSCIRPGLLQRHGQFFFVSTDFGGTTLVLLEISRRLSLSPDRVRVAIMQEYFDNRTARIVIMQFNRKTEISAWIFYVLITNTVGATSVIMEHAREGQQISVWEPLTWEYSSGVILLLLIPLILMLDRRIPIRADTWKRAVFVHAMATIPFSILHTGGMVAIRKMVYRFVGSQYDFGNVAVELLYEFRKDFLSYFFIVAAIYAYRMFRANHTGAHYMAEEEIPDAAKFLVKKRGRVYNISPDSVDWVEAAGNYVILHVGKASHPLRDTMKGIADRLGNAFCRVHRSTIVNVARITTTSPAQGGDLFVVLQDGTNLRCSRTMRSKLEDLLAARPE